MVILGIADQPSAAAAVVVDDEPVASVSAETLGEPRIDDVVPWPVVDAALAVAGVQPGDVDVVAFAGRFPEPLALRRHPRLRQRLLAGVAPLVDLQVAWQTTLRRSGFGAFAADATAEVLEGRLRSRGFDPSRVVMVDVHKALAEAAYRLQPSDDALVVALHPLGDGVALSVWRGRAGQLDRLWEQVDAASLHGHLARIDAALGLGRDARARLGALAARGTIDEALRARLADDLRADGRRLSRARPRPVVGVDPLRASLADVPREVAAASAWANLAETVTALVRRHVRAHRVGTVALAGEVFEDPRLVALVAEVPGVEAVHALPRAGRDALALGAAVWKAGLAPAERPLRLGPAPDDELCGRVVAEAGLRPVGRTALANRLRAGEAVLRWRGRPGPGRLALGGRVVLVRADDADAVDRVRGVLGLRAEEEPLTLALVEAGDVEHEAALAGPLRRGTAAPRVGEAFGRRYAPVVAPDRRAWLLRVDPDVDEALHQVVAGVLRGSGCAALAAFPVAEGDGPVAASPDDALAVFRRSGSAALQLGGLQVERGRG